MPISVQNVPNKQLLELTLVENIQRQKLTPLEKTQAFQRLQKKFQLTQKQIARKVKRNHSTVANTLHLLRLTRKVRELLAAKQLNSDHTHALLKLEQTEDQVALAREASQRGLSVRKVKQRVTLLRAPRATTAPRKNPNTRTAKERLRSVLNTRVEIARRGKKNMLRVNFTNKAKLSRLYDLLVRTKQGQGTS